MKSLPHPIDWANFIDKHHRYKDMSESETNPTPSRYQWKYKGVTFDFYRLCQILGLENDAQKHALKKIIRAGKSIKSVEQEIDEVISAAQRWKEMVIEDKEEGMSDVMNEEVMNAKHSNDNAEWSFGSGDLSCVYEVSDEEDPTEVFIAGLQATGRKFNE